MGRGRGGGEGGRGGGREGGGRGGRGEEGVEGGGNGGRAGRGMGGMGGMRGMGGVGGLMREGGGTVNNRGKRRRGTLFLWLVKVVGRERRKVGKGRGRGMLKR